MLQRDRADARIKGLKEALELLAKDKEGLVLQAEQSKIKTRTEGPAARTQTNLKPMLFGACPRAYQPTNAASRCF